MIDVNSEKSSKLENLAEEKKANTQKVADKKTALDWLSVVGTTSNNPTLQSQGVAAAQRLGVNAPYFTTKNVNDTWSNITLPYINAINNIKIPESQMLSKETQTKDQDLYSGMLSAQQEAAANTLQNVNAGINKSAAGLLGSQEAANTAANTAASLYGYNRANQASTQADYLKKMAGAASYDADAAASEQNAALAESQARMMNAGAFFSAAGGALQGAGTGAALGAAL